MILVEVHDGLFAHSFRPAPLSPATAGWRLLTPCDGEMARGRGSLEALAGVCPLLREAGVLAGSNHFEDFHFLLQDILRRAPSGLTWDRLFDDKHLHEVGNVTVTRPSGKAERWKIFQFQKQRTLVRMLWSYGSARKTLILTHMFVKPGGKKTTPDAELERARRVLESFLAAIDTGQARLINEQGGRDGFVKLG